MSWPRDLRDGPHPTDKWGWPIIPQECNRRYFDPNPDQEFEGIDEKELDES